MTLDLLDDAFLRRWQARDQWPAQTAAVIVDPAVETASEARAPGVVTPDEGRLEATALRLFERAPEQWLALARHVERARQRGLRVIAVAGGERGEGRSTLLACLAEALRQRHHDVVRVEPHDVEKAAGDPVGGGAWHDKRIVLVDAGIWFPPGPIRRRRLLFLTLGHDAVILVRRAGRPSSESRAAALESLGLVVLGEVLTFAAPDDCAGRPPEAVA